MNTTAKVIVGFLVGTALGTMTGLLLAPTSGNRTRKNINKKAKKLVKQFEGYIGKGTKKVAGAAATVKNGRAPVASR